MFTRRIILGALYPSLLQLPPAQNLFYNQQLKTLTFQYALSPAFYPRGLGARDVSRKVGSSLKEFIFYLHPQCCPLNGQVPEEVDTLKEMTQPFMRVFLFSKKTINTTSDLQSAALTVPPLILPWMQDGFLHLQDWLEYRTILVYRAWRAKEDRSFKDSLSIFNRLDCWFSPLAKLIYFQEADYRKFRPRFELIPSLEEIQTFSVTGRMGRNALVYRHKPTILYVGTGVLALLSQLAEARERGINEEDLLIVAHYPEEERVSCGERHSSWLHLFCTPEFYFRSTGKKLEG